MASECLPIIFDPDLSFPAENGVRLPRFLAVTLGLVPTWGVRGRAGWTKVKLALWLIYIIYIYIMLVEEYLDGFISWICLSHCRDWVRTNYIRPVSSCIIPQLSPLLNIDLSGNGVVQFQWIINCFCIWIAIWLVSNFQTRPYIFIVIHSIYGSTGA